jgi:hypothetical protein
MLVALASLAQVAASSSDDFSVGVDWASPALVTASTAATVEVDCCEPFLTRDPAAHRNGGGPFPQYMIAMQDLGADFVRWAPWYPYPRVVVLELYPPDCTATKPATNWDSTHFDAVTADFMQAVCGPLCAQPIPKSQLPALLALPVRGSALTDSSGAAQRWMGSASTRLRFSSRPRPLGCGRTARTRRRCRTTHGPPSDTEWGPTMLGLR